MRVLLAIGLLAAAALAGHDASAKGGKPATPPPPRKPVSLPSGCERLTDGRTYAISRDGARLAFTKWGPGPDVDYHGQPIPKSTVWVRSIAAKKDSKVSGVTGVPVGWTTSGGLCLSSGVVVDPTTGKVVPGTASMPKGASAEAIAWTRDGTRLAYAADWNANILAPAPGVPQVLAEVDAAGKSRAFDFGDQFYPGEGATLAWTADGKRVAFNAPFFQMGRVPPRRIGYVEAAAEPSQVIVAALSQDNGIPGMHEARRPMRPHPGTTGPIVGECVWNDAGTQLAYVVGDGGGNADLWLYEVGTEERRRQTTDGLTKWSPAIDGAGRRVAYLTGKVEDWSVLSPRQLTLNPATLRVAEARLHVHDVMTGVSKSYEVPGEPAYPGHVTWSPDGSRVLYEIHGGHAEGTYSQVVPPASKAPAGADATPTSKEIGADQEMIAGLRSGDVRRVEVACGHTELAVTPEILAAIHDVLPMWTAAKDARAAYAILRWIGTCKAIGALPDVKAALRATGPRVVDAAISTLVDLGAKDAIPDLDAVRTSSSDVGVRVGAASAMYSLGDERGFADIEKASTEKDADVRARVCRALAGISRVRSVEVLLALVADDGYLYITSGGKNVVGDRAVHALARLTGVFFRRDVARWNAWWKDEAKGVLPSSPDSTAALADYKTWMDEREAAYQESMKRGLPPGLKPK